MNPAQQQQQLLQMQAAIAQNPALQAQLAQMQQQQALLAQRASLAQPGVQLHPALQAQFAQQIQQQAILAQRASLAQPGAAPAAAFPAAAAAPVLSGKPPAAATAHHAKAAAAAGPGAASGKGAAAGKAAGAAGAAAASVRQGEAAPAKRAGSGGTKKRKAADARLLDKVNQLIPESPLFSAMQDAERRADMLVARKKAELQEMYAAFRRGPPGTPQAGGAIRKKLRVYVFNEHFHQPAAPDAGGAAASATPAEPPSWALHIQGRLVDAGEPPSATPAPAPYQPRQAFTHYIRKLQVQLDPAQYPGPEGRVGWEKSRHDREQRESFEVRRRGAGPVAATLTLELDYQPQQFSLSPPLSTMLGLSGLHSLPYIMQLLWGYIKQHGLYQSGQTPLVVRCDDRMRAAFGGLESIPLPELQEAVRRSCRPPDAATIQYTIRTDGPSPCHPDCYDFDFEVPLGHELPPFAAKASVEADLAKADQALTGVLRQLSEHKRRRTFLMAFAQNPVDCINALVATQARELRVAASKEGEALEVLAAGDVFREKWVEDAVMRLLHRRAGLGIQ